MGDQNFEMKLLQIFASEALGRMMHSENSPCEKVEYFLGSKDLKWEEAKNECVSRGMDLALPRSVEENSKLLGYMFNKTGEFETYWIGASDTQIERTFLDTNKRLIDFFYWAAEQPNNWKNKQDCISMGWLRDGYPEFLLRWNDDECNEYLPFACESKLFFL